MIELPPLPEKALWRWSTDEGYIVSSCHYDELWESVEARERILLARVAELEKDLADCFRLTGADPDGNEDWRLARDAVKEVAAMRTDLDLEEARVAELEAERDAARADAERYRWLRDSAAGQWEHPIVVSQKRQGDRMQYVGPLGFKELDAAIDAARGKE